MLDPTKKKKKNYPCPRAKEKPQQDGRKGSIAFRPNNIHAEMLTKPCVHQDPGTPQEIEPDLPLSVFVSPEEAWVSSGLPWVWRLWSTQAWEAWHVS